MSMKTLVHVTKHTHRADAGDGERVFVFIGLRTEIAGRETVSEGTADANTYAKAEEDAWDWASQNLCDQAQPDDPDHVDFELRGSIENASRRGWELYESWIEAVLDAIQFAEESA